MKQVREQPSVQRDMVRLRETKGDMLCLYAPGSPTRRSYRAVVEVMPINLSLKAEDEQEAIIERFAALIKSLPFPLQILVRNRRQDLAPYIQRLLAHPRADGQHPPTWDALAHSQAELLQKILHALQIGTDLSLAAWHEAFEASNRTLEHINKAMTVAQEVFDGHVVLVSGSLSEDLICDEFKCLTWK